MGGYIRKSPREMTFEPRSMRRHYYVIEIKSVLEVTKSLQISVYIYLMYLVQIFEFCFGCYLIDSGDIPCCFIRLIHLQLVSTAND